MAATRITTQDIKDLAVTTAKIADEAVTFGKLDLSATNPCIEDDTGIAVQVDDVTIERAAGGLQIKDDGVGVDELGIITTKGDLISFSSAPGRLAVGTDGQYLVANSGATFGVEWASFSGVAVADFTFSEAPSGTINGSNDTFTIAATPEAGTLQLYKNGIRQRAGAGNDYTLSGTTITFEAGNIPQTGDILLADYIEA